MKTKWTVSLKSALLAVIFTLATMFSAGAQDNGTLTFDPDDAFFQTIYPYITVAPCFEDGYSLTLRLYGVGTPDAYPSRFAVRWFANGQLVSDDWNTSCIDGGRVVVYVRDYWTYRMYAARIDLGY